MTIKVRRYLFYLFSHVSEQYAHTHTHSLSLSLSLSAKRTHFWRALSSRVSKGPLSPKSGETSKVAFDAFKSPKHEGRPIFNCSSAFHQRLFQEKKKDKTEKEKKNRKLVTEWKRREKIGLQNRFGDRRETTVTETGGRTRFPDRSTRKSTRYEQSEVKISYKQLARPGVKSGANNYF